tara:strand:+ start:153 stop:380 length:228 start_codon:yes stop_codon:yes gene_type:complete
MKLTKEELAKYAIKAMTNSDYANKNGDMIIEMITKAINNQKTRFSYTSCNEHLEFNEDCGECDKYKQQLKNMKND